MRNSTLRLLHYWWPLALGWSLTVVIQRATGRAPDPAGLLALLAGIATAYSLDRLVDPPAGADPRWLRLVLGAAATIATVTGAAAAYCLPLQTSLLLPVLGATSLLYPHLKRQLATKLVVLPLVWTWAAVALPFNDGSWLGWHALQLPIAAPLLLLLSAGCLLCDLKDEAADRAAGVASVPAMLGRSTALAVATVLIVAAATVAALEHRSAVALGAAALGVSTLSPALLATDAAGPLLVDVILTLPGVLIAARVV